MLQATWQDFNAPSLNGGVNRSTDKSQTGLKKVLYTTLNSLSSLSVRLKKMQKHEHELVKGKKK